MTSKKEIGEVTLEQYLTPADITHNRCVDEREADDATNGVQLPGGIYGVIDAIKVLANITEDQAWQMAKNAGIPLDAHIGPHGKTGCGYGDTAEEDPASVLAPESVKAKERLERVRSENGTILHYVGEHNPTHAVINRREGFTIETNRAVHDQLGVFNCDLWVIPIYASRLGLDPQVMEDHMLAVYKATVTKLTGITVFHEIR